MSLDQLRSFLDKGLIIDAAISFAEGESTTDLETAHVALSELLPRLAADHASWLIRHSQYIDFFLAACERALGNGYNPHELIYHITHLRCYKAVALALNCKEPEARVEILRAASIEGPTNPPPISVPASPSAEALLVFFRSYFDFLRAQGYESEVGKIDWIIEKALFHLGEDEHRHGITKALFVDRAGGGMVRNILVALEDGEGIEYQHLGSQELRQDLLDSSKAAREVAHWHLISNGYPEGLSQRKVIWQIGRPDGRAEAVETLYEGASAGMALTVAIISAYLKTPVPSDTAFTGAVNIHSARNGELVGVGGISEKILAALASGARRIYIPLQNEQEIALAARKSAEGKATIRPGRSVEAVCRDLFEKPKDPSLSAIAREVVGNLRSFLLPSSREMQSLAGKHSSHVLLSSILFAVMFALEGLGFQKIYHLQSASFAAAVLMLAFLGMFGGMLICYALPQPLMERRKSRAWWMSIPILGIATAAVAFLYRLLAPAQAIDTGPIYDWPPYLVIFKDLTIFWLFGVTYMTNIYCFVIALEYFSEKRQLHTVRRSIEGDDEAIGTLPTTVLHMPFKWAVVAAAAVAAFLLVFEMIYFAQLDQTLPQTSWVIGLGLVRDAVFIVLAFEVLTWYRILLADIKRKLRSPG